LLLVFSRFSFADAVCAKGYISLRSGPGFQFAQTWKVAKFMPFLRFERQGNWVKVQDLDGETHWARAAEITSKDSCVVVRTKVANLRREPASGAEGADLKTVDRYTPFKKLKTQKEWVQVQDEDGRVAWVHESQIWRPMTVNSISF
jgi:SH3-like domain-containing protein